MSRRYYGLSKIQTFFKGGERFERLRLSTTYGK